MAAKKSSKKNKPSRASKKEKFFFSVTHHGGRAGGFPERDEGIIAASNLNDARKRIEKRFERMDIDKMEILNKKQFLAHQLTRLKLEMRRFN